MANHIGTIALKFVADSAPLLRGADQVKQAMSRTADGVTRDASRMAKATADAAKATGGAGLPGAKAVGGAIDAMTKRAGFGNAKLVGAVGDVPEEFAKHARRLAAQMKREYPALAQIAEAENKKLVKVMADGTIQALTRKNGKLVYQNVDQIKGPLDATGKSSALERAAELARKASVAERRDGGRAAGLASMAGHAGIRAGGSALGLAKTVGLAGLGVATGGLALGLGASVAGLVGGFKDIQQADMQARRLGVTITELRTLLYAAGPAADAMGSAIEHFGLRLAQARHGSIDAVRDFQRLAALSGKGHYALGDMTTAQGFRMMLDRLSRIPDVAQQSAMAFDLLGDRAAELLPELRKGAAGLDEAQRVMQRFGLGVGEKDLASVREVAKTMRDLGALKDGFGNQVALGVAPIVAELTKSFDITKMVDLSGFKGAIVDAAEGVAKAGALVIEAWKNTDLIKDAWDILFKHLQAGAYRIIATLKSGFADAIVDIPGLGDAAMKNKAGAFDDSSRADVLQYQANKQWIALQEKLSKTDSFQWVDDRFKNIRNNRMGGNQQTPPGVDVPAWIRQANQGFAGMLGGVRSPLEAFKEAMTQIRDMDRLGRFAGEPDLKNRFIHKAYQDLGQAVQLPSYQGTGAALYNTREAYSAVLQHQHQAQRMTVQDQMKALMAEANRLQQEAVRIGKETLEEIRKGGLEVKGL